MSRNDPHARLVHLGMATFIIALLLAIALFASYRAGHVAEGEQAVASRTAHEYRRPSVCFHSLSGYTCSATAAAPDDRELYLTLDLRAQQEMAEWSLLIALISVFGVGVTGFGVYYVALTLDATREAVAEARAATKVAEVTANIARDTANRQLRAYVEVNLGGLKDVAEGKRPRGFIDVYNVGQTPAYKYSTQVKTEYHELVDGGGVLEFLIPDKQEVPKRSGTIGSGRPKSSWQSCDKTLTAADIEKLSAGKAVIIVFGCVAYRDIFDELHGTKFLHRYSGGKYEKTDGVYEPMGNDAD